MRGSAVAIDVAWSAPVVAVPEMTFGLAGFAAITLPMIVLSMGLGNVQGVGFLQAQGYKVAVNLVSVLVGIASTLNATFGGHPAIVARTGVAMLAAKEAGPVEGRYWGVVISALLTLFIAFGGTTIAALVDVFPSRTFSRLPAWRSSAPCRIPWKGASPGRSVLALSWH